MKKTFLILTLTLACCFHQQAYAQAAGNYATVIIYRPANYTGWSMNFKVLTGNDSLCYKATNNSKAEVKIYKEGKTTFYTDNKDLKTATLDLKFGQTYYLRCNVNYSMINKSVDIVEVPEGIGKRETAKIKK
jgi:hypothetical protein